MRTPLDYTPIKGPIINSNCRYPDIGSLKQHERSAHGDAKLPCPVEGCGKVFKYEGAVKQHQVQQLCTERNTIQIPYVQAQVHGPKQPKVLCNICGKTLTDNNLLRSHIISYHTAEEDKPIHCETCGKGFAKESLLKMHVDAVHLKLKPYPCKFCDSM